MRYHVVSVDKQRVKVSRTYMDLKQILSDIVNDSQANRLELE